MRRLLNQAANAAAKRKGSIFEIIYRRLAPRLGHNKTIGAIAHRICQLIWMIRGWMVKLDVSPQGGIQFDPKLFVEFGELRPHQVRLQGGDASSDFYCYP